LRGSVDNEKRLSFFGGTYNGRCTVFGIRMFKNEPQNKSEDDLKNSEEKYQLYCPYVIDAICDHDIIKWNRDNVIFYNNGDIFGGETNTIKNDNLPKTRKVTLFGEEYELKYKLTNKYNSKKYKDTDLYVYEKDNTAYLVFFESGTDRIISADRQYPALVEFDRKISPQDEGFESYATDFARNHLREIKNLDKYVPVYEYDSVTFYKELNGYKTETNVFVAFRGVSKDGERSGISWYEINDFDADFEPFQNVKIDKRKLQKAIDEARQNIVINYDKYSFVKIETDIILKVEEGTLFACVSFTANAKNVLTGEEESQSPLQVMVRVA